MMKLSEMKQILATGGIQLTKSLGQNFLHDSNQLRRIVEAAALTKTDRVLEIGPGLGPLTELLVQQAGEVLAIEKDARLVEVLCARFGLEFRLQPVGREPTKPEKFSLKPHSPSPQPSPPGRGRTFSSAGKSSAFSVSYRRGHRRFPLLGERARVRASVVSDCPDAVKPPEGGTPSLRLIQADALDYLQSEPRDWSDWKMVSNLPYSVASPILVELAQAIQGPQRIVATLQREVALRLAAKAGENDYGLLSLLVQLRYEPAEIFNIPASCFFPEPDVDSACVSLVRRAKSLLPEKQTAAFNRVVRRGFSQRRKMMFKLLKQDWPAEQLENAFAELELSPQVRAEMVSLEQFVELAKRLSEA